MPAEIRDRLTSQEFKEQERASQHQSRRKRERAALAAHQPVLVSAFGRGHSPYEYMTAYSMGIKVPDPPEKLARREAPASPSSPLIGHDALSPSLDQLARELGRQTIKDDPFVSSQLDDLVAILADSQGKPRSSIRCGRRNRRLRGTGPGDSRVVQPRAEQP